MPNHPRQPNFSLIPRLHSTNVISAGNDRYQDLNDEAGPLEVLRSRMLKLKAVKESV